MLGLLALTVIIAGCPPSSKINPNLGVTPGTVAYPSGGTTESIAIFNESGVGMFTWTAREVRLSGNVWVPSDAVYFSLSSDDADTVGPDFLEGTVSDETDRIHILLDRSAITPALIVNGFASGFGVEVSSDAGTIVIPVSVIIGSFLDVSPTDLNVALLEVLRELYRPPSHSPAVRDQIDR